MSSAGLSTALQVDQGLLLDRLGDRGSRTRRSQPTPDDELGIRRDRCSPIVLQQREVAHGVEQIGRPIRIQKLCADGDLARLRARQLVNGHERQVRRQQHCGHSCWAGAT